MPQKKTKTNTKRRKGRNLQDIPRPDNYDAWEAPGDEELDFLQEMKIKRAQEMKRKGIGPTEGGFTKAVESTPITGSN